jgi:hypothetical protein
MCSNLTRNLKKAYYCGDYWPAIKVASKRSPALEHLTIDLRSIIGFHNFDFLPSLEKLKQLKILCSQVTEITHLLSTIQETDI